MFMFIIALTAKGETEFLRNCDFSFLYRPDFYHESYETLKIPNYQVNCQEKCHFWK